MTMAGTPGELGAAGGTRGDGVGGSAPGGSGAPGVGAPGTDGTSSGGGGRDGAVAEPQPAAPVVEGEPGGHPQRTQQPLLFASGLDVVYEPAGAPVVHAVRGVELSIDPGEMVGLVGESGCGKSTLGYALTRLLRPPARITAGRVVFDGRDVTALDQGRLRTMRHRGFAVVLQSGMNALNPVRTIDGHFADVLRTHRRLRGAAARQVAEELLGHVELVPTVLDRFPHELSGGMRQRVVIALALALQPKLVVFDEPTTALDVLVQRAVMDTIARLQAEVGFSALVISHDLGLVLGTADRAWVMYAGRIVERRESAALAGAPLHPYSAALLACHGDPTADNVQLGGIPGSPPDLSVPPQGCSFAPRCWMKEPVCRNDPPERVIGTGTVACHLAPRKLVVPRALEATVLASTAGGMGVGQNSTDGTATYDGRAALSAGPGPGVSDGPALSPGAAAAPDGAAWAVRRRRSLERVEPEALVLQDVVKQFRTARRTGGRADGAWPGVGRARSSTVRAVDGVSLSLEPGHAVGLVGASGSGKTTLGRMMAGMDRPSSGTIRLGGLRVETMRSRDLPRYWQRVQMVFQDPYAGLNPVHTVGYAIGRALRNHQRLRDDRLRSELNRLLEVVGLTPSGQFSAKLPHQLSGGQRQRVVIARALAAKPQVLVADEPVSMLDVSLRAGILRLLDELRRDTGVSLLYITHDLLSARLVTDHLLVLQKGRVVESGPTASVLRSPSHSYTKQLIEAIPVVP